jgi:salicylate hydroxylase
VQLLEKYNPSAQSPPTSTLLTIFAELEATRIPRSSTLVKGAHAQGEIRVAQGVDACKARNAALRKEWEDPDKILEKMIQLHSLN